VCIWLSKRIDRIFAELGQVNTGCPATRDSLVCAWRVGVPGRLFGESSGECNGERGVLHSAHITSKRRKMKKLQVLWITLSTPRNQKVVYVLLTLAALAIASGAPGADGRLPPWVQ
jgi:hypothetical protein